MSTALERAWFAAVASLETCSLCGQHGVQVAHSNEDRGVGQKAGPWNTAALCRDCHYELDNGKHLAQSERRALMDRAIKRTHARLIETGRLKLV